MEFSKTFFTIDTHTAGHPERVITAGLPNIPGNTMVEKRDFIKDKLSYVRDILTHEPRGHSSMHCSFVTEPVNESADMGVIFIGATHYGDMCGHGTIATVTALLENGFISSHEGVNEVKLDVPGVGLVVTHAHVVDGKVESVSFENAPSFLYLSGFEVQVPEVGDVVGDIAYGGNWYFYLDAKQIGVKVEPNEITSLLLKGSLIKDKVEEEAELKHPEKKDVSSNLLGVIITDNPEGSGSSQRNVLIPGLRHFDRSPCGTGTSGRIATLHSKGKLKKGEEFVNESILGTIFSGKVVKEVKVGEYDGVIPEITGSAYITGFHQFVVDPDDPLGKGFYI